MHPDQDREYQRNQRIHQHPASIPSPSDIKIEDDLENGFEKQKRCQDQSEPGEAGQWIQQNAKSRRAVNQSEQQLPEKTADAAARPKPEEQMPDCADQQKPADDNGDTDP